MSGLLIFLGSIWSCLNFSDEDLIWRFISSKFNLQLHFLPDNVKKQFTNIRNIITTTYQTACFIIIAVNDEINLWLIDSVSLCWKLFLLGLVKINKKLLLITVCLNTDYFVMCWFWRIVRKILFLSINLNPINHSAKFLMQMSCLVKKNLSMS